MGDVYEYLKWRGDISFGDVGIQEADYLVFCHLAYLPFEQILGKSYKQALVLGDVVENINIRLKKGKIETMNKSIDRLCECIPDSPRFAEIQMALFSCKIDEEKEEQFCAMSFLLPDNSVVVSFRGTDRTLVGWKEDFNMTFLSELPSQADAVKYLEKTARLYPERDIYVCGHSKGGNLAIYSAAFCRKKTQERIIAVRNLDGPGFDAEILEKDGVKSIIGRARTYVPQDSVIGMLLEHTEPYYVVHSTNFLLLQHCLDSWGICRGEFETDTERTNSSRVVDAAMKKWVNSISVEERNKLVEGVYSVLTSSDATVVADLISGRGALAMIKGYSKLDDETKELIRTARKLFGQSLKKSLPASKHSDKENKN